MSANLSISVIKLLLLTILLFVSSCKNHVTHQDESKIEHAHSLLNRAALLSQRAPANALPTLDSVMSIAKALENDSLFAAALKIKGEASIFLGEYVTADSCFNAVLNLNFDGDEPIHIDTYTAFSEQNNFIGNHQEAIRQANAAYSLLKKRVIKNESLIEYKLCLNKGLAYFGLHKPDSMQQYMDQALNLADRLDNKSNAMFVYSYLGYFYYQLSDFAIAEKYFREAYKLARQANNNEVLSALLVSLSGVAIEQQKYDEGIALCNEALQIDTGEINVGNKFTTIYNNKAEAFFHKKDFSAALAEAYKSLEIVERQKDSIQMTVTYGILSKTYTAMKDYTKALHFSQSILNIMSKSEPDWGKKEILYNDVANLYKRLGDRENAIKYLEMRIEAKDSTENKERYAAIQEVKTKYETEQKDQAIKTAAILLKTHKQRNAWLLAFCVLLFILSISVYYLQRRKLQSHILLTQQNKKVAELTAKTFVPNCGNDFESKESGLSEEKMNLLLRKLLHCMDEEKMYKDPSLTLDILAETIGTNRSYLSVLINSRMKKGFAEYVNFYRIEEAKRLLCKGNDKIAQICVEAGFGSTQTFYSAFKQFEQLTPSEYRRACLSARGKKT